MKNRFDNLTPVRREDVIRICKETNTTIPKIAREIGCSPTTIYKYLNMGKMPKVLLDEICSVIFGKEQMPKNELEPIFPIYTKDILLAKFYLTRALEKMDELYLKGGIRKGNE